MRKKYGIFIIVLISILSVLALIYVISTNSNEDIKRVSVEILIEDETYTYELKTNGEYVSDVLNELKNRNNKFSYEVDNSAYGGYITEVNGKVANIEKNEYFAIYINDEYAAYGITQQIVKDEDVIKLVLEKW